MVPEDDRAGGLPVLHAGFIPLCDGAARGEIVGDKGPIALGDSRFFGDEAFRPEAASAYPRGFAAG